VRSHQERRRNYPDSGASTRISGRNCPEHWRNDPEHRRSHSEHRCSHSEHLRNDPEHQRSRSEHLRDAPERRATRLDDVLDQVCQEKIRPETLEVHVKRARERGAVRGDAIDLSSRASRTPI